MKKVTLLLVLAMLITMANTPMGKATPEIVLDASQVASARDIEMAVETVTDYGAHAGIVTLDGAKGKFIYTADDRSINIYYSNVTLRGKNGATLGNCDDGVFIDDTVVNNLVIENLRIVCLNGHAVIGPYLSQHHFGIIRNNYLENGEAAAIDLLQGDYWTITGNQIVSLGTGILLNETGATLVRNNNIRATIGVELYNSGYDNTVSNNKISAWWRGVVLSGKTLGNQIKANKMDSIQESGIVFIDIVAGNQVSGNQIICWPGVSCTAVTAEQINYDQNKISGNKVVKPRN